ncbi:MAG: hypothetical protein IJM54_09365 [Thermoguttaceae bacterium]|nr:hypothetical protein [Thermoguttaceae bacterium]
MNKYRTSVLWCATLVALAVLAFHDRGVAPRVEAQQTAPANAELDSPRRSIEKFFEDLTAPNGNPRQAVDNFVMNTPMADNEKARSKIVDSWKTMNANFGGYVEAEEVGVRYVGADLVVFRYLCKFENYPVVWYFTFYRSRSKSTETPSNAWRLIGVRYDANLDAALLDATFNDAQK